MKKQLLTIIDNYLVDNEIGSLNSDSQFRQAELVNYSDDELELGKKIENPYTIKNMNTALQNLLKGSNDFKEIKVVSNYKYIRILPSNETEFHLINSDRSIDLYTYPLDYKIEKQGNKYKDKSVGESEYTWLYCTIPINRDLDKSLKVELIEELFLPFGNGQDDDYSKSVSRLDNNYRTLLESLDEEALRITNNLDETSVKNGKVTSWYASGRIRVRDERLNSTDNYNFTQTAGWLPVEGCFVRARKNWFVIKNTYTNNQGNFFINHAWNNSTKVEYSIKWDTDEFDIRSWSFGQAYFNTGTDVTGSWFLDINIGTPDSFVYAHVHRGAHLYYNRNQQWGIQAPPTRTFFNGTGILGLIGQKMHIYADAGSGGSHYFEFNTAWFAAQIKLKSFVDTNPTRPDGSPNPEFRNNGRKAFGTTIHELAHSSHWKLGFNTALYIAHINNKKLTESWSNGVAWKITRDIYGGDEPNNWLELDSKQDKPLLDIQTEPVSKRMYTPLFVDIMDNFNQGSSILTNAPFLPNENVNVFTLSELEGYLSAEPTNWYQYRNHLQNNANHPFVQIQGAVQLFNDYDN